MAELTAAAIERIVGPVDETMKAQILQTGANEAELLEAFAWVNADDALVDSGRSLPKGRVAELIDILRPPLADEA